MQAIGCESTYSMKWSQRSIYRICGNSNMEVPRRSYRDVQVTKSEFRDMGKSKHFLIATGDKSKSWKACKNKYIFRSHHRSAEWTSFFLKLMKWKFFKTATKMANQSSGEKKFINVDEERTGNTFKSCHLLCCLDTL